MNDLPYEGHRFWLLFKPMEKPTGTMSLSSHPVPLQRRNQGEQPRCGCAVIAVGIIVHGTA